MKRLLEYAENMMADENYSDIILAVRTAYETAYKNAKAVFEDALASQAEIEEVYEKLLKAGHLLNWHKGDLTKLQRTYDKFAERDLNIYTEETRKALEAALKEAKEIIDLGENAVKEMINSAYAKLQEAIFDLREIPNKDRLDQLLEKVKAMDLSVYSAKTASAVKAAYAAAVAVFEDENADQKKVDEAVAALEKVIKVASEGTGKETNTTSNAANKTAGNMAGKTAAKTGDAANAAIPAAAVLASVLAAIAAWRRKVNHE